MNWQNRKPKPAKTNDICVLHNRRLRDYEVFNGGCMLCALEAKAEKQKQANKTVIHVLKPL